MKKIFAFLFLFASVTVSAQNNTAEDTAAKPAITAIGKPDGAKAEMKIGKDGGSFTSSDGKLRLIIPDGAISKKTTLSIQPITNLMPNGNGKAYRLEPSGIKFKQPVQLVFHYTEEESKDTMPLLMGIAMQDNTGQWYSLKKFTLDTVAKIISGNINHFSDWSKFDAIKISPSSASVRVGRFVLLDISGLEPSKEQTGGDEFLTPLARSPKQAKWSVNDIVKGNSSVGILTYGTTDRIEAGNMYKAPDIVPKRNPVAVEVKLQGLTKEYNGIRFNDLRLVSNIFIYDKAYEVKMESVIKSGGKAVWGGIRTAIDEGSFIVSLEKSKPAVINIINNLEVMADNCANKILNPTTCTGLLHVAGIKDIKVTPANPPGQPYPIVEILFVPFPMEFSVVQFLCPPPPGSGDPGWSSGNQLEKMNEKGLSKSFGRALPWDIKFIAKEGEQIIINSSGEDGSLKIWVRQLKDD